MRIDRVLPSLLLVVGAALSSACVAGLVVRVPPPAVRIEVRGAAPSPDHVWIAGHWAWEGRWVWVSGRWAVPPRGHGRWEPGRWERRRRGWVWIEGRWRW